MYFREEGKIEREVGTREALKKKGMKFTYIRMADQKSGMERGRLRGGSRKGSLQKAPRRGKE